MGTKGGKPLSTLEKKQKKVVKEEPKKKVEKEEKREVKPMYIDESLISKAVEEVENSRYSTIFNLAQKLNVKYSIARKIVREVVNRGEAEIISKNRRVIVISSKK